MKNEYAIVPARPEHMRFLPAIERECARLFPEGAIPAPLLDVVLPEAELEDAGVRGNLWVAESLSGSPVGFALRAFHDGDALLAEMDVLPDHGRRGIGAAFVRCVAEKTRLAGASVLFLTTFSHIPWNAPFYSRLGFVPLRAGEAPDWLETILKAERECGFLNRIGMRLELSLTKDCVKAK